MTVKLKKVCLLAIGGSLLLPARQNSARQNGELTQSDTYSAAFYSGDPSLGGGGAGLQSLVVFPFSGPSYLLRLPFAIGYSSETADRRVLYADGFFASFARLGMNGAAPRPGIFRFELDSMRTTLVPGSSNLAVFGLSVSQREDKLLVSGQVRKDEQHTGKNCGLYELSLPNGALKKIIELSDCSGGAPVGVRAVWSFPSLSPDGERAVAVREARLEFIDLKDGRVQSLGGGFETASWSPDGKWIAALDS